MHDIIIIGGGLAGLSTALRLSKEGLDVLLIEKKKFPFHRVCGEYISNEVRPFLKSLGVTPEEMGASPINKLFLTSGSGKGFVTDLPLGGFGISRYFLDHYLAQLAEKSGVKIMENTQVIDVDYNDRFSVRVDEGFVFTSKIVIGSFGKRSNLDRKLNRAFFTRRSPYIGVKQHIKAALPPDVIALHNFPGGYCGINKIEDEKYCLCYLTHNRYMKTFHHLKDLEENVLFQNPILKDVFKSAEFLFPKPEVINEISFEIKTTVENHILMIGDAVGMISPLCGNGMSIAMHSGKILSDIILKHVHKEHVPIAEMEREYKSEWEKSFKGRLIFGKYAQALCGKSNVTEVAVGLFKLMKPAMKWVISQTHGKSFLL